MMHTTFRVAETAPEETYTGYLAIHYPGGTHCFDKEVTLEYPDCETLEVIVERVGLISYLQHKISNPVLRWLLYIPGTVVGFLLAMVLFVLETYGEGIHKESLFSALSPFTVKSTVSLSNPNGCTVDILLQESVYHPATHCYTPPDVRFSGATAYQTTALFSTRRLKRQLLTHALPGFCFLWALCIGLCALSGVILAKVIREVGLNSLTYNLFAIAGMAVCCAFMVFLLLSVIRLFIQLYRHCGTCTAA